MELEVSLLYYRLVPTSHSFLFLGPLRDKSYEQVVAFMPFSDVSLPSYCLLKVTPSSS